MCNASNDLHEILSAYDFPSTLLGAVRYGQGHINDTYCVVCQPQEGDPIRFILQGSSVPTILRRILTGAAHSLSWLRTWKRSFNRCMM